MKPCIKNTIITISYLAIAALAFYLGLSQGFGRGYTYRDIHVSSTGAIQKVVLLEWLRSGKVESAIDMLERHLDMEIISHRGGLDRGPAFPHIISYGDFSDADIKLMTKVAKYRTNHPTQEENPRIKDTINYVVRHYSQGSR